MARILNVGEDIVDHCIRLAQDQGAEYADARYVRLNSKGIVYRNGEPISGGTEPSAGIGIRILVNGSFGFAAFNLLDRETASNAVESAIKIAKNAKRKEPIELGEPVSIKAQWSVPAKQSIEDVDLDTLMGTMREINKGLTGLASYSVIMSPSVLRQYLLTSEGTEITSEKPYITIMLVLAAKGDHGTEQRYIDMTQVGGWERVKEAKLIELAELEAKRIQNVADKAVEVKELMDGPIDMVVGSEVAGIIAHENVGHPSEGDRIMGREGAQAGESFWRDLKIGESRVGSNVVSVSDDPTIPFTGGFYEYDDEGVKSRKRELIKNGVINEPLLNREFGVRFGLGSNGAARATNYNREPIIRMANTYFEPGDYSFEELIEDVKLGVYMTTFTEWNIDDRRYQSKYTGCEAFLIKDGEVTETYVKRPVLETTSVGLLTSIDAVSKELRLPFPATCGKGDPMQGIPVYAGGGELRIRNIRLGGVG